MQLVLRGALIPKPAPRATLRPGTLRDPGVRAAIGSLIAETTDLTTDGIVLGNEAGTTK